MTKCPNEPARRWFVNYYVDGRRKPTCRVEYDTPESAEAAQREAIRDGRDASVVFEWAN